MGIFSARSCRGIQRVFSLAVICWSLSSVPAWAGQRSSVVMMGQKRDLTVSDHLEKGKNGELMAAVRFANGATAKLTSTVIARGERFSRWSMVDGVRGVSKLPFTDAWRVRVDSPHAALKLAEKMNADSSVQYAHPDFIFPVEARNAPSSEPVSGLPSSEPYFDAQWNLSNSGQGGATPGVDIGVESAWAVTRGSPSTLVAVLDVGFEQSQKDMAGAWFVNAGEIPGNKKDDDKNGLIDDVSGWNFSVNGPNLIYGAGPNHGTATAGIIGARANGVGITGICPECTILPVVVSGRVSEDASAIGYAFAMGAVVMSNSWGYNLESPQTDVVSEALANAAKNGRQGKGTPIVFAMHNAEVDDCRPYNPDISGHPDVIAVSSVDFHDVKVPKSGFGKCLAFVGPSSGESIHGIPATDRTGERGYNTNGSGNFEDLDFHNGFFGTSAAAPQVSGLFALLLTAEPGLTREQALSKMKASAIKANPAEAHYDPATGHSTRYGFGRVHAGGLFSH